MQAERPQRPDPAADAAIVASLLALAVFAATIGRQLERWWLIAPLIVAVGLTLIVVSHRQGDAGRWTVPFAVAGMIGFVSLGVGLLADDDNGGDHAALGGDADEPEPPASAASSDVPSCQEDGRIDMTLVYAVAGANSGIVTVGADGERAPIDGNLPAARGQWLAFVDDERPSLLTIAALPSLEPEWSHTVDGRIVSLSINTSGDTVAAVESPDGDSRLSLLTRTDGAVRSRVLRDPRAAIRHADLSPDGRKVAWVEGDDLMTADVATMAPVRTLARGGVSDVAWSGSGSSLAFSQTVDDSSAIHVARLDENDARQVTSPSEGANHRHPTWVPDCDAITYVEATSTTTDLWTVDLSSGLSSQRKSHGAETLPSYGIGTEL